MSERKEVAWAICQYARDWQIKDGFLLGLSEFSFVSDQQDFNHGENGLMNSSKDYVEQLVYFVDIIAMLATESKMPMESFVQEWDRDWFPLEQQVLSAYNIKMLDTPQSEERIGPNSFIMLPETPMEVQCDLIARYPSRQPALIFANARHDRSSDADPDLPFKTVIGGLIHGTESILDDDTDKAMQELLGRRSHSSHSRWPSGRPTYPYPSYLENVKAYHGDEGHDRMPEEMRALYEQRLIHLRKMRKTHLEIEVAGKYCLVFRRPELPVDNEVCQYCQDEQYLILPRKGAKWLADGNSTKLPKVSYKEPDHLKAPYANHKLDTFFRRY